MTKKAVLGLPASMDRLTEITGFIEHTLSSNDIDVSDSYAVSLAADEICTNVISYSNAQRITVAIEILPDEIIVTIADDGVPFDPLTVAPPDIDAALEEREPGGLGIHLMRKCMADVSYEYQNGKNILRMVRERHADNSPS